jgi:hypothetical protein
MLRVDLAALHRQAKRSGTDTEPVSGFCQIHPAVCYALIAIVARDFVVRPKRRHAFPCPSIPVARQQAVAVERARQHVIGTNAGEHAHGLNQIFGSLSASLPTASSWDSQFGMDATVPVNEEDFAGSRIDVDDHFMDHRTEQPLLHPHIGSRPVPHGLQVGRQPGKFFARRGRYGWLALTMLIETGFDLLHPLQGLIPAPL